MYAIKENKTTDKKIGKHIKGVRMTKVIRWFYKKILARKLVCSRLETIDRTDNYTFGKEIGNIKSSRKDKYVFSSVFPNEEVMRKVDAIMTEGDH